ncbi:MAG: zinc-ribbon domain-containing protein [Promethearchaeota archaeon]|nr:MAG: zinc-ribbon domain-containing protein [Candidatus Lokiarchaeota archaeon]
MSEDQILRQFGEFGKYIYYIAILIIISCCTFFIPYVGTVLSILQLIFLIQGLGVIKRINSTLNNHNLEEFRSKIILGMIITVIAIAIISATFGAVLVLMTSRSAPGLLVVFLGVLLVVFIIMMIGAYLSMKAWENLNEFFIQHRSMFPNYLADEAIEGTKDLKNAALCTLLFFLIITLIIGFILQIIGYFKLGKMRELEYSTGQGYGGPSYVGAPVSMGESSYIPPASPSMTPSDVTPMYCPACGARLRECVKFCPKCGSNI